MRFDAHTCELPRTIQALLAAGRSPAESAPAEGLAPQFSEDHRRPRLRVRRVADGLDGDKWDGGHGQAGGPEWTRWRP